MLLAQFMYHIRDRALMFSSIGAMPSTLSLWHCKRTLTLKRDVPYKGKKEWSYPTNKWIRTLHGTGWCPYTLSECCFARIYKLTENHSKSFILWAILNCASVFWVVILQDNIWQFLFASMIMFTQYLSYWWVKNIMFIVKQVSSWNFVVGSFEWSWKSPQGNFGN